MLDCCEHVADSVAALVSAITRSSRSTRLLATSRVALGVDGESTLVIYALPVPSSPSDTAMQAPAIALFADRARRADPGFELTPGALEPVVTIVEALDPWGSRSSPFTSDPSGWTGWRMVAADPTFARH